MFRRKAPLPEPARRKIREITTERVLAWAQGHGAQLVEEPLSDSNVGHATGGEATAPKYAADQSEVTVAATVKRLVAVTSGTSDKHEAVREFWWHEVDRAFWVAEESVIRVSFTTVDDELMLRVGQKLPMEFLAILRDRVENSVVLSETIALTSAENARVAVRRDQDGDIFVEALYDEGIDPSHPVVMKKVAPVVARLREVSGAR